MSGSVSEEFAFRVPDAPVSEVVEDGTPVYIQRRDRWLEELGRASLRKRVLHDIAPVDDEAAAIRLYKKLSERIRNNPRGCGVMCFAAHLDGGHSHLHIVHDCVWNSTSCKCMLLQGVTIKKRQSRYNKWSHEILPGQSRFWERILAYLYGRGRRYFIFFIL